METLKNHEKRVLSRSWQISIKLITISIVMLLLLIPRVMIIDLINEREYTSESAKDEIMDKWSREQTIRGPILTVPYIVYEKNSKGEVYEIIQHCHFLPKTLNITGGIKPEELKRSIYKSVVYESDMKITGQFESPDFDKLKIDKDNILWDKVELSISISDLRGISNQVSMIWNGKPKIFSPVLNHKLIGKEGISVNLQETSFPANFEIDLILKGSHNLQFAPFGESTHVNLSSTWNDPGFDGYYLPSKREVTPEGFTSEWNILHYNRNFPQEWINNNYNPTSCDFGVNLVTLANHYQKSSRSAKYSSLIILLIFMSFFLNEIITKQRVHPFQYILIGFAVLLFYLLLLSFSEHAGFNIAYLIASLLVTLLVLLYSKTFLKTWKNSFLLTFILILSFIFIFILLQLESYALLAGSIGLFVVLGAAMFFTRKINWYEE